MAEAEAEAAAAAEMDVVQARNILARARAYEFKRALEPPFPQAKFY